MSKKELPLPHPEVDNSKIETINPDYFTIVHQGRAVFIDCIALRGRVVALTAVSLDLINLQNQAHPARIKIRGEYFKTEEPWVTVVQKIWFLIGKAKEGDA